MSLIVCTTCGAAAMGGPCPQCGELFCDPCETKHDCRATASQRRVAPPEAPETAVMKRLEAILARPGD